MADVPDPEFARVVEEILATAPPGFVEWRRAQLEDPEWEDWRRRYPALAAGYLDPEVLRHRIDHYRELLDPFSEVNLETQKFLDVAAAGGTITVTDMRTGEVVHESERPGSPQGAAWSN